MKAICVNYRLTNRLGCGATFAIGTGARVDWMAFVQNPPGISSLPRNPTPTGTPPLLTVGSLLAKRAGTRSGRTAVVKVYRFGSLVWIRNLFREYVGSRLKVDAIGHWTPSSPVLTDACSSYMPKPQGRNRPMGCVCMIRHKRIN